MINYLLNMSPSDFARSCDLVFDDGTTHTQSTLLLVEPNEGLLKYQRTENAVLVERVVRIGIIRYLSFIA